MVENNSIILVNTRMILIKDNFMNITKKKYLWIFMIVFCINNLSNANTSIHSNSNWIIGGDLGLIFPDVSKNMMVANGLDHPYPQNYDQYSTNKHNNFMLAGFVGKRWEHDQWWIPAYLFALRYQHFFSRNIGSTIKQKSELKYENYLYNWSLNANVLTLFSKVDLLQYKRAMLYLDGGIGATQNNVGNYNETALPDILPRISPAFGSRSTGQFAWSIGTGIDVNLSQGFLLSIGYEYQSLGAFNSNYGLSTWSNEQLHLANYNTNTLLLSLNYLFGSTDLGGMT